ncbi:MAG: amidohydrolase family protein [Acidobacteriia bacterium]|nr:amidohydrolase family protein [Terriglobia bacterium]
MMPPAVKLCASLTLLAMVGCKPPEDSRMKAIIGAVLIDPASPPISRSVIVIAGSRIRLVGEQAHTPVPAGSDKINGAGKFLIASPVVIPNLDQLPRVHTLAEVKKQMEAGATVLAGMIADTSEPEQHLIQRMRDLRVVFVPQLHAMSATDSSYVVTLANTKKLAQAGVLIAASAGPDALREWALLGQAGLTPEQILTAATVNAARAAKLAGETGSLVAGLRADLLLLSANPLEDAANMSKVERRLTQGEWVP